jgi:signal transduction histidine kinase/ligand-binding sensor domain-containing protein
MKKSCSLFVVMLWLSSCEAPDKQRPSTSPSGVVETQGIVTTFVSANAPDTAILLPELIQAGPLFTPVEQDNKDGLVHIRTFTTDDGLPMDDVMCGTLDRNGLLWFGTNGGGITRYDGHSFTNFNTSHGLPDNVILSLFSDSKGNLWIGTSTGGLCKYDGRSFATITLNNSTGLTKGVKCIIEDRDGALWFGTRGRGVYKYDGSVFTNYTALDRTGGGFVRAMTLAEDGAVWVATLSGVARFAEGKFNEYTSSPHHSFNDVCCISSTDSNTIWLGHVNGGLTRCTVNQGDVNFKYVEVLPQYNLEITAIASADNNALWIGTKEHGALYFDADSEKLPRIIEFSVANGMAGNEILSITEDAKGDMWFGMRGAGLCHYRGPAFSNFTSFRPVSLAEDAEGVLYAGTSSGIVRKHSSGLSVWNPQGGFESWTYSLSSDKQGRVGFAENLADLSRAGFTKLEGDKARVLRAEDDRVDIFWSMHDRHNRLWLAGRRGIERWSDGKAIRFGTKQGLGNINGLCLLERFDGSIWAGTDGGGFSRIDSTSITTWTTEQGLPNDVIWCLAEEEDGILWIATLEGLCRFDGKSFLTYTTQHGLPDNSINQVLVRKNGTLIIGTLKGIAALKGWNDSTGKTVTINSALRGAENSVIARLTPVFEVYNSGTGFPVKDVQTAERSLFEDTQRTVWIATGSDKTGLVRFNPAALRNDSTPLIPQLLRVTLNNEPVCWHHLTDGQSDSTTIAQQEVQVFGKVLIQEERSERQMTLKGVQFSGISPYFSVPEGLVLDYRNNQIGFEFAGIETKHPEVVQYQYMLEGYDSHWSVPSANNTASFGNIREGNYTFKVRAKNPIGNWNEPLEYSFTVRPPWQRTWWAFGSYCVLTVLIVIFVISRRTALLQLQKNKLEHTVALRTEELRLKKEEADEQRERAELSEKAKERFLANMSHEIRTPMNAIMGMSEILKNRPHAPEQEKYLNAIAQSSDNLLVIINDILDLTKIDAGRIEFEKVSFDPRKVINHVKDILQFKADEKNISLSAEFATRVPETLIGDPTRLNQIIMNLCGNAIKFTETGGVRMIMNCESTQLPKYQGVMLIIDVIDTGIGIPEDRIDKIFDEFTQAYSDTTRKYGGTGLGLTISRRLAQLQGGDVTVRSIRDKGSTFTIRIPYGLE